jgi:hypothetical protein
LVTLALGKPALGHNSAEREEGIPVTDPLVIAKCGDCNARDEHGSMQHLSWERTTPEGWQDALKDMILREGLSVTPAEARSIVKYLSSSHGLAAEEAEPMRYDPERRIHDETPMVSESLHETCAKCHSFTRSSRRADWSEWRLDWSTRRRVAAATGRSISSRPDLVSAMLDTSVLTTGTSASTLTLCDCPAPSTAHPRAESGGRSAQIDGRSPESRAI